MNSSKRIPIFYACDDNFVKYTMVSIQSLIEHASSEKEYVIHVLNTGICEEMKQVLSSMENDRVKIRFEDVTGYLKNISEKLPIRDYYSHTTYYRMFIAEMFPEYDKAVYIDSDTVVLGDISELYDHEIGENYVGAAPDQVVVQTDVFGDYAEQVLGVDRLHYFNAGILVMNCRQFREQKLLEQFVELLHMYNFVVAQDQDYLNVICENHVQWIEQQWNTEVFGTIAYGEEEFKLIHYNLAAKPWHYGDCRYQEYFWKYAEKTAVYEEIKAELEHYTEEERKEDALSGERLLEMAKSEIAKENNYLKLRDSGKLKAKDRLEVLDKIAVLEREGRFDEDVEEDPPTKELKPEDIDYLRKKISSKIKRRFTYTVARSFLNNILESKKLIIKEIKGIEHFKNVDSGAIVTCNHFNAFDSFAIQIAYEASEQKKRKFYRVIREGNYTNFPGFYGLLMRNCNTFPLSSNKNTMKKFLKAMDIVLQNGDFMLMYPEQSMWWNYRKPKPLKKGAYTFAVRNNVPVLPCFITMEDSDILGDDGFYVQEYTIHVAEPIYPDARKSRAENIEAMRARNYEVWKQIYEETYGEKLVYTCQQKMKIG